jgi:hypothetical protein
MGDHVVIVYSAFINYLGHFLQKITLITLSSEPQHSFSQERLRDRWLDNVPLHPWAARRKDALLT